MGMYTELFIAARITPYPVVIEILKHMQNNDNPAPAELPDHPFFKKERWNFMLQCTSYYFVPTVVHALEWDEIGGHWSFVNFSNFKNYDNELASFIDWLTPYIENDNREMIGYSRYEEEDEPTILYSAEKDRDR
jgi:hypothetical protein